MLTKPKSRTTLMNNPCKPVLLTGVCFTTFADTSSPPFQEVNLNTLSADAWDDTLLITAFEKAVQSHRRACDERHEASESASQGAEPSPPPHQTIHNDDEDMHPDETMSYERRPRSFGTHGSDRPLNASKRESTQRHESDQQVPRDTHQEEVQSAHSHHGNGDARIPPPPPFLYRAEADPQLEGLLYAWYEAGYKTGMYVARASDRANK